jgi:ubiquinone/menaquinone biosynthesis C-methylase UbiE
MFMDIKKAIEKTIETYSKHAKLFHKAHEHQLLQFQLNNFLSKLPGKKILDAGCGSGRDAAYFIEEGFEVTGIDLADGMLEELKKNSPKAEFKKMDMRHLDFSNNSFDGIWAMASVIHIPKSDISKTLSEFYRVLKPAGILYLAVKEGEGENIIESRNLENSPKYVVFYKKEELEEFLKEANFKIIESTISESDNNVWIEIMAKKEVLKNIE